MELDLNLAPSVTCVNLSKPLHLSVPREFSSIKWVQNTYVKNLNTTLFLLKVPVGREVPVVVTQLLTAGLITTNQHVLN